eukprot:CAMPEP_0197670772 /NCGR_PEP_ID=MMETSP1338-20131121/75260_1 /TAXON_ID=43686 ORGANISM="Pelagodinium beii, Strain RCC1491" /NCGR_SAMPLE_ID=MMETSP1338 /ASSEMBLY_ACC=CAM_ASM_000754 /LENGTH=57 /DNA_ID=CAMNT_0043250555 /DNA_START=1 /DNA_END=171 /DNA_ORIENTATION=+
MGHSATHVLSGFGEQRWPSAADVKPSLATSRNLDLARKKPPRTLGLAKLDLTGWTEE